jgi:hypothetical protein
MLKAWRLRGLVPMKSAAVFAILVFRAAFPRLRRFTILMALQGDVLSHFCAHR